MLNKILHRQPKTCVAIDFSSQFIKALEFEKNNDDYKIKQLILQAVDNQPLNIQLKNLIQHYFSKTTRAIFALPYNKTIIKNIEISREIKLEEIENFLLLNMSKYIGCEGDQVDFDYTIENSERPDLIKIKMIATKKEQTQKIIALASEINLKPIIIDVDAYALLRAINILIPDTKQGSIMCVNINCDSVLLCVEQRGKIIYIQEDSVTANDAKNAKAVIQVLINAMQICLAQNNVVFDEIFLSGEMVFELEILNVLQQQLQKKIQVINPLAELKTNTAIIKSDISKIGSYFIVCTGLALRGFKHDGY